jgi:predicted dehydrogenase
MGRTHAFLLSRGLIKNAKLVAVADISKDALDATKAACGKGLRCFDAYWELSENAEFDAVIVAVPHYFHIEIAKFFIERGKHVLIEKPVSVTVREAAEFNEFLREYDANVSNPSKKDGETDAGIYSGGQPKKRVAVAVMYNQRTNRVFK